jgi:hypothetical protein
VGTVAVTLAERARVAELPPDTLLTPTETAAWLALDNHRLLPRLRVPCVRMGHRTIRYRKGKVQEWLDKKAE